MLAASIAHRAHEGQFRRDGITPYITHPAAVAARVKERGGCDLAIQVAWLHGVIEETEETGQSLINQGVDERVVEAVMVLTKRTVLFYSDYLAKVAGNRLALTVKIADMLSNLADDPTDRQIVKYSKGLIYLLDADVKDFMGNGAISN